LRVLQVYGLIVNNVVIEEYC